MSCKHGTLDVCTVNEVSKYHIVCARWWIVCTLPLRHNREYFVKYQNILLANATDGLKYEKCQLEDIWRGCVGHKCMDMIVARPTT
jgi:hypothetical protein